MHYRPKFNRQTSVESVYLYSDHWDSNQSRNGFSDTKKTIFLQLQEKLCPKVAKLNKIKENILVKICGVFDLMATLRKLLISINF